VKTMLAAGRFSPGRVLPRASCRPPR
jgi:hypothetical protein